MTPAARIAAAIEILDRHLAGSPAEQALTGWARGHRFAGSGDRAAIRDHVFDALRCKRSFGALGGAVDLPTGRALMIGALRDAAIAPETLFTGEGHAPGPLTATEACLPAAELPCNVAIDCPDWLAPVLEDSLGDAFVPVMRLLRQRAPVTLRVNLSRTSRVEAQAALAAEGIAALPHPLAETALQVTENPQKLRACAPYLDGRVELQDSASQAVVAMLPLTGAKRVLDYCAGGGGKTLAMAARAPADYVAHDIAPQRMRDLPERARRAGIRVDLADPARVAALAPYDLVLLDVPCSGSGSWRRAPEAKWALTPARLAELRQIQAHILDETHAFVAPGGVLAYVTCSMLGVENGDQVATFLQRTPGWHCLEQRSFTPLEGGDGFFCALLTRVPA
ncbi:RsmB/NOP family class I SAM-dependent RNA methyltransferase [Frigidibacter sp.]|uniref:RsmB/NOP family class I SAM-dependent RNA methyltransferase n=1 Tax=Frigidibacter sp. TaxID=2586418 RepID=UPI00273553A1|nr:RsmB/NOP family class I SAM-dependent RNA methyltransferase [Frigidibacter sp.]MDP3339675.1 RsmB/NOP family class I SAM-dependent RNA methyltransferase [Frigidibacter sp.]